MVWQGHSTARLVALASGSYAIAGGVVTLLGWAFDIPRITAWKNDGISMFPNTAACAVISGLALVLSNVDLRARWLQELTRCAALFVALTGALTLFEHISGINLGIDTLLFNRPWGQTAAAAPMRMGPPASTAYLLIGTALMLLHRGERARAVCGVCAMMAVAISTLSLTGHLYDAQAMYTLPRLTGIAMQTASVVLALGVGILASLPEREPMRTLSERSAAGLLLRWAAPIVILLSVTLGWLRVWIETQGFVDSTFGTALRTLVEIALIMILLWRAAVMLRAHEKALQESEAEGRRQAAQLAAFLDTAAIAIHRVGADGTILWANQAELRMLGYRREEYEGHNIAEFHVDPQPIADMMARLHRGEQLRECAARMRCKDGSIKLVLVDSSAIWQEGQFAHTQCFTRDITERRRNEDTRALLAAIIEASDDAIVSKALDGTVTSWNSGAQRIFGYSAEEMIGQSILRIVPSDRTHDVSSILEAIGRGERVQHFESERVRKDGQRIKVSLTVSPVRDASGRIIGASKIARDVTEQKRIEGERQRALLELTTLYDLSRTVAGELDRRRVLQTITDAATRLSGARFGAFFYDAGDSGRYLLNTVSGATREQFERFREAHTRLFAPTFAGEGIVRFADIRGAGESAAPAVPHEAGDAPLAIASYLAVPAMSRISEVFGGLFLGHPEPGMFTEESERVVVALAAQAAMVLENAALYAAEQRARAVAEEASKAKDQFLAMLGHELRNPLSAVRNAVTTAAWDPPRSQRALEIARHGTDQLARLVDDLLDVTRITQGRITLRKNAIALNDIVQHAADSVRPLFADHGVGLVLAMSAEAVQVEGDVTRLEQVVGNLLANAGKYTEPGGAVTVSLESVDGQAVLRVRDTGIGIAPELLPRMFDLFVQGEPTLDRARGGLGIGLTVVKQLVEMHGGSVEAHSGGVGHGAELTVRLPIHIAEISATSGPREMRPVSRAADRRVLIVEDNADAAESLMMLLEVLGLRVRVSSDAAAALDAAYANPPDVMLIDIGLPGMNGYELTQRIRQDPLLKHITLVALTGYGQEEDKRRAFAAGFDYHLVKPIDPAKLDHLVADIVPAKTVH